MHAYVALVTLLALLLYTWMVIRVGGARARCGLPAPAVTGDPLFERHFRVQANTLENLVVFLPSMWLFAVFLDKERTAAALGLVWILGRALYMFGYVQDPKRRGPGFGVQALAQLALLIGALVGVVLKLVHGGA